MAFSGALGIGECTEGAASSLHAGLWFKDLKFHEGLLELSICSFKTDQLRRGTVLTLAPPHTVPRPQSKKSNN